MTSGWRPTMASISRREVLTVYAEPVGDPARDVHPPIIVDVAKVSAPAPAHS